MPSAGPLRVRAIRDSDKFNRVSSGGEPFVALKTFLIKHAHYYEEYRLARTYIMSDTSKSDEAFVGYVTLVCSEIDLGDHATLHPGEAPANRRDYPYTTYPALKIARLLIDKRRRGEGHGSTLVDFAFGIASQVICPRVGCRFIVVDSKKNAVDFYAKRGFELLDTTKNKKLDSPIMFVDLKKVDDQAATINPQKRSSGGTYQSG
jgi:GNAT superfamily N-acetyltransferase